MPWQACSPGCGYGGGVGLLDSTFWGRQQITGQTIPCVRRSVIDYRGYPMRNVIRAAVVVLAMACAAPVAAGPFEDGETAWRNGDHATALRLFRALAEEGKPAAQARLGLMYFVGIGGVPQNYAEAAKWYRLSANQGTASPQTMLGLMYARGQGVPQDYVEAVRWYRKAAEQGFAAAQTHLGVMYEEGRGVPQDYVEAHKWWNLAAAQGNADAVKNRDIVAKRMTPAQIAEAQKLAREWKPKKPVKEDVKEGVAAWVNHDYATAIKLWRPFAEQGDAVAQFWLGYVYRWGEGVPMDYTYAYKWWSLAAARGFGDAAKLRNTLANLMTPTQIADAQKLAREWKPTKQ
jgi:uncharacterized protein